MSDHDPDRTAAFAFPGGGEMARAVNAKDWSQTLLGPPQQWPGAIRSAVTLCLNTQFQMAVLAGPELVYVYNDACAHIFGDKHPWALGQRVQDVWPEAWESLAPLLNGVLATGEPCRNDDLLLVLNRAGFSEECHFTVSYSPIHADQDSIAGVLVTTMETTLRVLSERRQRWLGELAARVAQQGAAHGSLEPLRDHVATNPYDLPLAALYLADGACAKQVFCSGLRGQGARVPRAVAWRSGLAGAEPGAHPFSELALGAGTRLFDASVMLDEDDRCGAWAEPPRQLMAVPLVLAGHARPRGFLVVALNPFVRCDGNYQRFIHTAVGLVATAVASADALEAERRRAEALAELDEANANLERRVHESTRELREANQLLAAVFDRAPGGIAITCADGAYLRVNPAYASMLGYSDAALVDRSLAQFVDPADYREAAPRIERLLAGEIGSCETEMRFRRADGDVIWVLSFLSVIDEAQGKARYLVHVAKDITRRRKLEAERRAAQEELKSLYRRLETVREMERTALAREVHDQLGQTLSAAKIDLRLLEDLISTRWPSLQRDDVGRELHSASATLDRALQIVRQIATELRAPELDGQGLYAAMDWHARDFEQRTRIRTTLDLGAGLPQPARPTAEALLRIFQEALTNVLRHAHASEVRVTLERRGERLLLRVRDDGVGIGRGRLARAGTLGITGMRERAELAHGRLAVGPVRPAGTLVSALVPIHSGQAAVADRSIGTGI